MLRWRDLAHWLERLTVNPKVATFLGSKPVPSSDIVESDYLRGSRWNIVE